MSTGHFLLRSVLRWLRHFTAKLHYTKMPVTKALSVRIQMTDWRKFFEIAEKVLGEGRPTAALSSSWCSWTTFQRLKTDAGYWQSGLPAAEDIKDDHILDGGTWMQPFLYSDLAHVIIPAEFYWEKFESSKYSYGTKTQNIKELSRCLDAVEIPYRITPIVLEIKCY